MSATAIDRQLIKGRVRSRLLSSPVLDLDRLSPPERRLRVRGEVMAVLREERAILPASAVTDVVNQVSDEVVGLGPIERLLRDPEVSEVMVNGADDVYVERKGRLERVGCGLFEGEEAVLHVMGLLGGAPGSSRTRTAGGSGVRRGWGVKFSSSR